MSVGKFVEMGERLRELDARAFQIVRRRMCAFIAHRKHAVLRRS